MSEEIDLLKSVCVRLELADIPYMLTGSLAANFYAMPRMTRDIDIVIEVHRSDVNCLIQIFQHDFYIDRDSIDEAIKYQSMFNIIHNHTANKIDFIIRKDAAYRAIEFKRRKRMQLGELSIWIVAPEDLIVSKMFWAKDSLSEMQIRDVRNLFSNIKNLDNEYIQDWVQKLELNEVFDKVKADA